VLFFARSRSRRKVAMTSVSAFAPRARGPGRWQQMVRWLHASILLTLWAFAACTDLAAASAAGRPSEPPRCDLTVLVLARPLKGASWPASVLVALSYSRIVDHQRLRASIADLMARVGGRPGEIVIEDAPLELQTDPSEGKLPLATAAQFQAPGLIRAQSGVLPVGAIIRSLPDWRHMRVVFVVDDQFPFRGPHQAAADGFVLRLINQVEAYEYDVERMSGKVSPPEQASLPGPPPAPLLPAVLIGMVTGFAAGWLLGGPLPVAAR